MPIAPLRQQIAGSYKPWNRDALWQLDEGCFRQKANWGLRPQNILANQEFSIPETRASSASDGLRLHPGTPLVVV